MFFIFPPFYANLELSFNWLVDIHSPIMLTMNDMAGRSGLVLLPMFSHSITVYMGPALPHRHCPPYVRADAEWPSVRPWLYTWLYHYLCTCNSTMQVWQCPTQAAPNGNSIKAAPPPVHTHTHYHYLNYLYYLWLVYKFGGCVLQAHLTYGCAKIYSCV